MSTIFVPADNEIEVFERCHKIQLPLLLKGPTGCGKSRLVEFMAERLDMPLIKVACNEDTNSADLLGRFLIKGGETVWQDGPVTQAVRRGGLLYLDEIAEAREDVVVAIHPLTDHRREVYLDKVCEVVSAPKNFMFVASFNPGYQRGLKDIKPSTRQRFVNITMGYLPAEKESALLCELTGIDKKTATTLTGLASKVRSMKEHGLKETISTRLLVNACRLMAEGMDPRRAAHVSIAEALSDDVQVVGAMKDLINLSL